MHITIRKRLLKSGKYCSLVLDFSPPLPNPATGKATRWKSLGIRLHAEPSNARQRAENRTYMLMAEKRKAEILLMINSNDLSFLQAGRHETGDLVGFYRKFTEGKKTGTALAYKTALSAFVMYAGDKVPFSAVTKEFLSGYRQHLLDSHSQGCAAAYFARLRTVLNEAYREGLLKDRVTERVKSISPPESRRGYLMADEVLALAQAGCRYAFVKRAGLLSILTGMRVSDIEQLDPNECLVTETRVVNGRKQQVHFIRYQQQKTGMLMFEPVPDEARDIIVEQREECRNPLFDGLRKRLRGTKVIREWVAAAGIDKPVTFHWFRHTWATLQLSAGTPLVTVSKMLGHSDLRTTQIYAKIVDELKVATIGNIKITKEKDHG